MIRAPVEYPGIEAIEGPLIIVRGLEGIGWNEYVEIRGEAGDVRHGVVLEVNRDLAVVQAFEGAAGLNPRATRIAPSGHPLTMPLSEGWLGRVCNGRGEPIDRGPPVFGRERREVGGFPLNPTRREPPADPVITGMSVIDALHTLVRGQKLPIFSVGGLPHLGLAVQIASQAQAGGAPFRVVFAAMGLTHPEAEFIRDELWERAEAGELALFLNTADDPIIERILTPRLALTLAEFLAFERGHHVLVVLVDMTNYCEAVREVAAARGEVPTRQGYPGNLYSDLASLYERCGRLSGLPGSITLMPVLTMPAGDITHPVPDLTGYITEGQIVLSRERYAEGIYPPVDALSSLSRLMRDGAGPGRTRDDHLHIAAQMQALLAAARSARELADLLGEDALVERDRRHLVFAERFSRDLIAQRPDEFRDLDDTLDRCWQLASLVPRQELTRVTPQEIEAHLGRPR